MCNSPESKEEKNWTIEHRNMKRSLAPQMDDVLDSGRLKLWMGRIISVLFFTQRTVSTSMILFSYIYLGCFTFCNAYIVESNTTIRKQLACKPFCRVHKLLDPLSQKSHQFHFLLWWMRRRDLESDSFNNLLLETMTLGKLRLPLSNKNKVKRLENMLLSRLICWH